MAKELGFSLTIDSMEQWQKFNPVKCDWGWLLTIHRITFDQMATKVAFNYKGLKFNAEQAPTNQISFDLYIHSILTKNTRKFKYLGQLNENEDHWTSLDGYKGSGSRVDIIVKHSTTTT